MPVYDGVRKRVQVEDAPGDVSGDGEACRRVEQTTLLVQQRKERPALGKLRHDGELLLEEYDLTDFLCKQLYKK